MRRRLALTATATTLLILVAGGARGQGFYPAVIADVARTDNVAFVSDIDAEDTVTRLALSLPFTRGWQTGSFTLDYRPEYVAYDKFEELDNFSQFLDLDLTSRPTQRSTYALTLSLAQTQQQGGASQLDSSNLFLDRRTDRERGAVSFSILQGLRNRWSWRLSTDAETSRFDEITEFNDPAPPTDLEDRDGFGANLELARETSRNSSVGIAVGWQRFDLEVSGEETVRRATLVLRRQVGSQLELALIAGGYRATGSTLVASPDQEETGWLGEVRLLRTHRRNLLELVASHAPTLGGARLGTSLDSTVSLSLRSRNTRRLSWEIFARYSLRDPDAPDQGDLDSRALEGRIERRLGQQFALQLRGSYFDQSGDRLADEGSFSEVGLGLVWYPRGQSPDAGDDGGG